MSDKVVNIFEARKKAKDEQKRLEETPDGMLTLEEIAKKNKANEERLKKERAGANKSVLRSYRIKS